MKLPAAELSRAARDLVARVDAVIRVEMDREAVGHGEGYARARKLELEGRQARRELAAILRTIDRLAFPPDWRPSTPP